MVVSTTRNVWVEMFNLTANHAVNLPTAATAGQKIAVSITDPTGLNFDAVVTAAGADTIGSAATATYHVVGAVCTVVFEADGGTNWHVVRIIYPRVIPIDASNQLLWALNDFPDGPIANNSHFVNTGHAGALDLIAGAAGLNSRGSPFGQCIDQFSTGGDVPLNTGNTTVGEFTEFTCHAWFNWRQFPTNGGFFTKAYRNDGTWNAPFGAIDQQLLSPATNGAWFFAVAVGGVQNFISVGGGAASRFQVWQTGDWMHMGFSYSQSTAGGTMVGYTNGSIANQGGAVGNIDYGTHGPWWVGSIPTQPAQSFDGQIAQMRVDNTIRSQTYMERYYLQGIQRLPLFA
jgi:hypothetical protein